MTQRENKMQEYFGAVSPETLQTMSLAGWKKNMKHEKLLRHIFCNFADNPLNWAKVCSRPF